MDSIPDWLSIILIVLMVMLSAFFSASETSFACINRFKMKAEADSGKRTAKLILHLSDRFETTLIATLVGHNVVSILISTISTFLFLHLFKGIWPDATVSLLASIVMTVIVFLFGDTLPKLVGKRIPDTVAKTTCYPLYFFYAILFPISMVFRFISFLFRKMFHAKPDVELTEEEFQTIIDEAEEAGVFEENESDIIQNTLDFADTSVKEVFTPRKRMKMLRLDNLTTADLLEFIQDCPYSRIPAYYGSPDKIVGILVVKNYLNAYFQNPRVNYAEFLQKPYFVTTRVHLDDLVDGFKKNHTQIAIVRSQDKVLGMVTMEDVLEELVGTINEPRKRRTQQ